MSHPSDSALIDQPSAVREENRLDLESLLPWLRAQVAALPDVQPTVAQYPGGASNLTYALDFGDRTLILRRPPTGTRPKSGHDMGREYRVMSGLYGHYPVPKPLAACEDESIIGAPFYVMEKLEGIILRRDLPAGLSLDPQRANALCRDFWQRLIDLHQLSPADCGLAELGRPEGYVKRQIEGWNGRYQKAATEDAPDADDIMAWLDAHQIPENGRASLIHNDYRFDNVVLSPDDSLRIIGVLDWEMCTVGDPLLDLGCALAYWVHDDDDQELESIRMQPSNLAGMMRREDITAWYEEQTGVEIGHPAFYLSFGLFRLAVIAQQIYYRYAMGQTTNPRYKPFGAMVHTLVRRARITAGIAG